MREKTVSVETMRRSDARTIAGGVPSKELMYRAGKGIFEAAAWRAPVGIVCGKGNNAGDGYVVALLLREAGIPCELLLVSDAFSEDGRYWFGRCAEKGIPYRAYDGSEPLTGFGSLLDCLFGTGFSGEVREPYRRVIGRINESGAYVVSADINSGLNGDTGEGTTYVVSDLTVSIGSYKHGHFRGLADRAMKARTNVDIGITIVENPGIRIADTTREERERIVAESIGNLDGLCDGCSPGLAEMYQDYIDGKRELREINAAFRAGYMSGAAGPDRAGCALEE